MAAPSELRLTDHAGTVAVGTLPKLQLRLFVPLTHCEAANASVDGHVKSAERRKDRALPPARKSPHFPFCPPPNDVPLVTRVGVPASVMGLVLRPPSEVSEVPDAALCDGRMGMM